jgi:ATPase
MVEVDVASDTSATVYMDEEDIAGVIGKAGKNIDLIEKKLGIHIDIRERKAGKEKVKKTLKSEISGFVPTVERSKKHILLHVDGLSGETVDVHIGDDYLFTATVGRKGDVKIGKDTEEAHRILMDPSLVTMRKSERQ